MRLRSGVDEPLGTCSCDRAFLAYRVKGKPAAMPWLQRIVAGEPRARPGSTAAHLAAVAFVVAATGIRLALGDLLPGLYFLTFFPAVVAACFLGGLGPGLVAAIL